SWGRSGSSGLNRQIADSVGARAATDSNLSSFAHENLHGDSFGLDDLDAALASGSDPLVWWRSDMNFWTFVVDLTDGKVVKRWRWAYWFEVDIEAEPPDEFFTDGTEGPTEVSEADWNAGSFSP
ncbi:MAG: hypothetical protein KAI66_28140, partial [Lentisphaeria bacterium]|nr:hypothetical protein [Lentisphaeria bacterium]